MVCRDEYFHQQKKTRHDTEKYWELLHVTFVCLPYCISPTLGEGGGLSASRLFPSRQIMQILVIPNLDRLVDLFAFVLGARGPQR